MAKNGFKILDSDMHVMEPADLWVEYTDAQFQDQAPRGLERWVRDLAMVDKDGNPWGRPPEPKGPRGGHKFHDDQVRYKDDQAR
ncbi:MAG TPA: hypothetical protein VK009_29065, partial [Chloroflexota bacterium]|nr:hypothetical protein [Chloroflexota bacterium]